MTFHTGADQVAVGPVFLNPTVFSQTRCRMILISSSGTGPVRFGDSGVAAGKGVQIPSNVAPTLIRTTVGDITDWIDLTLTGINVPAGTTCSVTIGC